MSGVAELHAVLRTDFYAFVQRAFREVAAGETFTPNWHIEAMCYVLGEIGLKRRRRQIIEVPPRSLKSVCSSVALVAWLLGHDPTRKIICVSYSQDLASQFSALTRQIMKSDWYTNLFPGTIISSGKDTERYFRTTAGGYRDSTSVGGTLTGKGADLIVIDDPAKPDEMMSEAQRTSVNDWFDRTLTTRLNNKRTDGILLVMQRLHPDDLSGHVKQRGGWDVLTLPAIAMFEETIPLSASRFHHRVYGDVLDERREAKADLDERKLELGARAFQAQYQQDPLAADGAIIDWAWFKSFGYVPKRSSGKIVQSWDCASKSGEFNDFSVCTTWLIMGDSYFLFDIFREKLQFPDLIRAACKLAKEWRPDDVLIEDAAAGTQLIQQLVYNRPCAMPRPVKITPVRDKVTRLHTVSNVIEQGRVLLPLNATWLDDFKIELIQFPFGKFDDQIDSLSQFLTYAEHKRMRGATIERQPMFGGPVRQTR